MNDNDIDNLLKEKASQINENKYNYKVNIEEIKNKAKAKKKGKVIKISFISAACACILLFVVLFISNQNSLNDNNVIIQGNENNKQEEVFKSEDIVDTIICDENECIYTEEMLDYIVIIKVKSIDIAKLEDKIPTTIVSAEVIETIQGGKETVIDKEIKFKLHSGICKVKDVSSGFEDFVDKTKYDENKYLRFLSSENVEKQSIPEEEKEYITSLAFKDNEYEVVDLAVYSFYEYDSETKKVKIGDEWQDIDYSFLVW